MNENPWHVDSVQAFAFLNCPECSFKTKEEDFFQSHAIASHPMCFVLFGQTEVVIEEVTLEDQKPEYIIEVKASEAPSKSELASAIASIEDPNDSNDPNYDPNDPNYDPNDDIEANPVDECENKVQFIIPQATSEMKSGPNKRKSLEDELNELGTSDNKVNVAKKLAKKPKKAATLADFLDGLDETKFTCYYCDKMFKNRKFLNEHFKKHLDSNGNFPCKHCNIVKSSYREIATHISRSHNPGFCKECNKSFHGQTSLARHQKAIHGNKSLKKFKCEFCPYVTHTGPYLYEHRTKKHGNRVHRSIASVGVSKGLKDKQFVCSECNGYFSNKGSILHHVCGSKKGVEDEYLYKCQKCNQTFKHGFFITHHKRTHGCFPPGYENVKKVTCDKCGEQFLHRGSLQQHMKKSCTKKNEQEKAKAVCDLCSPEQSFNGPNYLIRHYRDAHGAFPPIYENRKKYICSHCPNIYICEVSLKAHVSGCHTKKASKVKQERFFQCGHCDKKYAAPKGLKNHMIIEHEGGPQFACTICSRKMPCQATLNYHVKQVHTKVTCEICNEVMYNAFYLKRHKASVHGMIQKGSFKCQYCPLIFKQNLSLEKHINSKHR